MAMITVNLRIVGLYFNEPVEIDDSTNPSVRDVLDTYIKKHPNIAEPGGLEYGRFPVGNRDFLTSFTYNFSGIYNFDGNDVQQLPPDGPTLGRKKRPAGIYTLGERMEDQLSARNVGLIWQYYVVSASPAADGDPARSGIVKSKTSASRGFNSFGEKPTDFVLEAGDSIIWRLIAIAREPNFL